MARYESVNQLVGGTPLLYLKKLSAGLEADIWVKLESWNPMSSVKDRIGLAMIEAAEKDGRLKPGGTIIEATSGNTGIALAYLGAVKGYKVIITMPETMSIERRRLLASFGAQLELTPGSEGMPGAVRRANQLLKETPGAFLTQQFDNEANFQVHYTTTGQEIWDDSRGEVDIFIAGVGTGGTVSGVGARLKELKPEVQIVALEPDTSPVIGGGKPGPHKIQGIGAGFIPGILKREVIDRVLTVNHEQAGEASRLLARTEGLLAGISAGANLYGALELAKEPENKGKTIVTVICDTGERYLSTWLFEQ